MRIRNLMSKPSTVTGNPLVMKRWGTLLTDDGDHFTVNSGSNSTAVKTGFDIINNLDIKAWNNSAPWITSLPDCRLCFSMRLTALVALTVKMRAAGEYSTSGSYPWIGINTVIAKLDVGQPVAQTVGTVHRQGMRNACKVELADDSQPQNTDVLQVSDITIVTGEEMEIMDLLAVGAFSALTAPYILAGGGQHS